MKLSIGPGALVAAAFIGPGTVTACTLAGVNFGQSLIWALAFATFATIILQSMAARLGVVARLGLGEAVIAGAGNNVIARWVSILLILAALAVGNSAYEAGNLGGGALGLEAVAGEGFLSRQVWLLILAGIAGTLLVIGKYRLIERFLIGLVILMALVFMSAFIMVGPDIGALFAGFVPSIPEAGLFTAMALIGTTIVPYNLFLHAATARDRWRSADDLDEAITDTRLSVGLGGLVSILILSTAATALFGKGIEVTSAGDMALAIEPLAGPASRYLLGIGLFAAGLTSTITAPMATAYAVSELIPRSGSLSRKTVQTGVALLVLVIGLGIALSGQKLVEVIFIAQMANGLLLPIIAGFLLVTMNRKSLLGEHTNTGLQNLLGGAVTLISLGLGIRIILRALQIWP
ncbi:MAG: divalent metal cation transporter [Pseudomonadota bacterium]